MIIIVNILDYEKLKNGEDWQPAIQQALKDSDEVVFPEGVYKTSKVVVSSNKTIKGVGEKTVFIPIETVVFLLQGTTGVSYKLTKDMDDFSNVITVSSVTDLKNGDFIKLKSQRECLNYKDSGDDWTLGYPSSTNMSAFFGEFLQIDSIENNTIKTLKKTIFPYYFKDKTKESSNFARECSTIERVDFIKNTTLSNFKILGKTLIAIQCRYCYDCHIKNIIHEVNNYNIEDNGCYFIQYDNCYCCDSENCIFINNSGVEPKQYYYMNVFRIIGSMRCGFKNCKSYKATQTIDIAHGTDYRFEKINDKLITIKEGGIPSSFCYAINNDFCDSSCGGITSHGGTYKILFENNILTNCRTGICCRSRSSKILNNDIFMKSNFASGQYQYGIALFEGWAKDCIVSGNHITGAKDGLAIIDSEEEGEWFRSCDSIFSNNIIKNCFNGFNVINRRLYDYLNVLIEGNMFVTNLKINSKHVYLSPKTTGITFQGNHFITNEVKGMGISADWNCFNIQCNNNVFKNCTDSIFIRGINDKTLEAPQQVTCNLNTFLNVNREIALGSNITNKNN